MPQVTDGDPRSCPAAPNGYPCATTVVSVKLDSGTALIWGTVMDQGDGTFIATYEVRCAKCSTRQGGWGSNVVKSGSRTVRDRGSAAVCKAHGYL